MMSNGAASQIVLLTRSSWTCQTGSCGTCASAVLRMKEIEQSTYAEMFQARNLSLFRALFFSRLRELKNLSCLPTYVFVNTFISSIEGRFNEPENAYTQWRGKIHLQLYYTQIPSHFQGFFCWLRHLKMSFFYPTSHI